MPSSRRRTVTPTGVRTWGEAHARLWAALRGAGRAVDVVVVGQDPERLAAAEPVLAGWTKAPAAAAGAENRRCGTRRPGEVRAIEAAVARGDLAALEVADGY